MAKAIIFYLKLLSLLLYPSIVLAQQPDTGLLAIGDAVLTGFSGVKDPQEEPSPGNTVLDETFVDPDGIAVRIIPLAAPGYRWDARVWPAEVVREFTARDVGQVFGVAIDDERYPNIYVTATSAYGLHIIEPDKDSDGRPERLSKGSANAQWMEGMWGTTKIDDPPGPRGGPGSVWRIDGKTGEITLFANVELQGAANGGAGLGNISYDAIHRMLFVSDLSTGMIHRFALDGSELQVFDPGNAGMKQAGETGTAYDPQTQLDISSGDFDTEDPETWGYTDENRRVWGLAVHGSRLYYAFVGQSEIWSVGLDDRTGSILADARWELDVPKKPKKLPVTDIVFTRQGAMLLAQRGQIESIFDYSNFADPGKARVYRYWLENPDDQKTPGRWIPEPEEYAIGFDPDYRATAGGLALGHGYTREGFIDAASCEASLWITADNLRRNENLAVALLKGGPQMIDGLQGAPTGPVRQYPPEKNNTPPWVSYMVDVETSNTGQAPSTDDIPRWGDVTTQGWIGDVEVLRGCGRAIASDGGGTGGGGGYFGWPVEYPYWTEYSDSEGEDGGDELPCLIGVDCPPPPERMACAKVQGQFQCDPATGEYTFNGTIAIDGADAGVNFDEVKFSNMAPGHTVLGGPLMSFSNPGAFSILGAASGQILGADLCLYNAATMQTGQPFACCKVSFDEQAPLASCKLAQ